MHFPLCPAVLMAYRGREQTIIITIIVRGKSMGAEV